MVAKPQGRVPGVACYKECFVVVIDFIYLMILKIVSTLVAGFSTTLIVYSCRSGGEMVDRPTHIWEALGSNSGATGNLLVFF